MAELMEAVKKELDETRDAVAAIVSNVDALSRTVKWLKDHPVIKEDPELADVAQKLDGLQASLKDAIARSGASAEVADGEPPVNTMSKKTA